MRCSQWKPIRNDSVQPIALRNSINSCCLIKCYKESITENQHYLDSSFQAKMWCRAAKAFLREIPWSPYTVMYLRRWEMTITTASHIPAGFWERWEAFKWHCSCLMTLPFLEPGCRGRHIKHFLLQLLNTKSVFSHLNTEICFSVFTRLSFLLLFFLLHLAK